MSCRGVEGRRAPVDAETPAASTAAASTMPQTRITPVST
jgi:hypothetical protein